MENRNYFKQLNARAKNNPERLEKYVHYLAKWVKQYLETTICEGYAVGISGGVDSAVAAALISKIEGVKLLGVFTDIESSKQDYEDAKKIAEEFKFELKYVNLTETYQKMVKELGIEKSNIAKINLKSRLRASTLYAIANANNLLTCGTTNAAERLVGYYTKFGDNACDIAPLVYLTKANIYYVAGLLGVPSYILTKKPSAGLYEGQTDEQEMGITYKEIDHYLCYAYIDPIQEQKINTRYIQNKHKLDAPARPKKYMSLRNTK